LKTVFFSEKPSNNTKMTLKTILRKTISVNLSDAGFHSNITGIAQVGESFEIGCSKKRFKGTPAVDSVTKVKYAIL
jgi:hypothetical protein